LINQYNETKRLKLVKHLSKSPYFLQSDKIQVRHENGWVDGQIIGYSEQNYRGINDELLEEDGINDGYRFKVKYSIDNKDLIKYVHVNAKNLVIGDGWKVREDLK